MPWYGTTPVDWIVGVPGKTTQSRSTVMGLDLLRRKDGPYGGIATQLPDSYYRT